jgi:hypothetical protein
MSLEDLPGINRLLGGAVSGPGLTFEKFTGNSPNMGNRNGDYIIYVSGNISVPEPNVSSGYFDLFDFGHLVGTTIPINIPALVNISFSFSVMLTLNNIPNFTPTLTLHLNINNIGNSTTNLGALTWDS